jgi:hypothetical protein
MATYTYTTWSYETQMSDEGKCVTLVTPHENTFPLSKLDTETDQQYMYRMYSNAAMWTRQVDETAVPAEGHARNVWLMYGRVVAMSDDELSEELFETRNCDEINRNDDIGVFARTYMDLLHREMLTRMGCARN